MFNALIYIRIGVSFDVFFQWGVMQSRAYTEINLSPIEQIQNWKFRTFGFLDILKVYTVHFILQVLFYLSFKQNYQKKTNFFYVPHSSVWDFKSLIALSSLQVKTPCTDPLPPYVQALACCTFNPWLVNCLVCEHLLHRGHEFCREKFNFRLVVL